MNITVKCPACLGRGSTVAIVCGDTCIEQRVPCNVCAGGGWLPPHRAQWVLDGQRLRALRREHEMTLRATASTLGVSPTLLSECEQGRSHQAVTLHRMLAERLACKGAQ